MKVLHVIPSLSPREGGPSFALPLIARSVAQRDVLVDVATTDDDGPGGHVNVRLGERMERDGYSVIHFRKQTEFYKVSLPFRNWMAESAADYDIVHIHALYSYVSNCAARLAARNRIPYIVRPLGVLDHWGMQNRRRRFKSLSFRLIERPILRRATAIHYTSRAEQIQAEHCGATPDRGVVVPLGIDTAEFAKLPRAELFLQRFPQAVGRTLVLFLARVDVKKGLDLLLPAFAQTKLRHSGAMLVVAGAGDESYVCELKERAAQIGVSGDVIWPGFLSGCEKLSALAAATVFVLPSHSENFGIALVEAMAAGLPCIATEAVAVSDDIREHDAGVVVQTSVESLAAGLDRLLDDAVLRSRLGANARRLVGERFSIGAMGVALRSLYDDVLKRGRRPVAGGSARGEHAASVSA